MIELNQTKLQSHAKAFAEFESVQLSTAALKALQKELQVTHKNKNKRLSF